jgi:hypothetical protein
LDCPDDWLRLADFAEAWGHKHVRRTGRVLEQRELADAWWTQEVLPLAEDARRAGRCPSEHDLQLYLDAMSSRRPG